MENTFAKNDVLEMSCGTTSENFANPPSSLPMLQTWNNVDLCPTCRLRVTWRRMWLLCGLGARSEVGVGSSWCGTRTSMHGCGLSVC